MKEIVILSGKGGTGKTSLTAAFSYLAHNAIFCDADVDASDLHLLMKPSRLATHDFIGGSKAEIDKDLCSQCGRCLELCRFEAISDDYKVDDLSCEGCGVCVDLCPSEAILFPQQKCGEWFTSSTRFGPMVHAKLGIGEENSGKLVHLIRKETNQLATKNHHDLILTDGPPGIGCPVIASISGASALVLIVEPSLSGIHDMERVAELGQRFKVPILVCINKYDINKDLTKMTEDLVRERHMILLGRIPFDPIFTHAMVQGLNIFEYQEQTATQAIVSSIWEKILSILVETETIKPEIQLI